VKTLRQAALVAAVTGAVAALRSLTAPRPVPVTLASDPAVPAPRSALAELGLDVDDLLLDDGPDLLAILEWPAAA
jgi:hypothetical protein